MNSFVLLATLIIMIIIGTPIPIAMGFACLIVFIVGSYNFHIIAQILILTAGKWTLLTVPFFILAASFMNELGVTERLFKFARACVGHIRGGLAHVNVLSSMIFAGMSGAAVADIGGLGKIEIKAMTEAGFSKKYSAGITVASSIIGPIIPPSIAFVLYGIIAEVSIARLFLAGILPGILIGISLMIKTYFLALKYPEEFPREKKPDFNNLLNSFKGAILVVMAPLLIILGMTSGYVSPTEAGAAAMLYSLIIGLLYRTFKWKQLWSAAKESLLQAAHAMLLLSLAGVMGYILTFERTPQLILSLTGNFFTNKYLFLLFVDIIFLIIGCFMSATASLIILTPILLPMAIKAGIDPIHFGIIISYALHLGIATPPVGIGLYVVSDIANIKLEEAISGVTAYYLPLIISLIIISCFPNLSLILPNILMR